jgi:hypothetical protein
MFASGSNLLFDVAHCTRHFRGLRKSFSNSPELKHLAPRYIFQLIPAMDSLLLLPLCLCAPAHFDCAVLALFEHLS